MKRYYPSLNCYPSAYPALSQKLLNTMALKTGEWVTPSELYPDHIEAGRTRVRTELGHLNSLGFLRHDCRGYQLAISVDDARSLFAYKQTPTQRLIIADIIHKGFVYARQFSQAGKGDATQFLRAIRPLESQGVVQNEIASVPGWPHIKRRIYTFTERAKKSQ